MTFATEHRLRLEAVLCRLLGVAPEKVSVQADGQQWRVTILSLAEVDDDPYRAAFYAMERVLHVYDVMVFTGIDKLGAEQP